MKTKELMNKILAKHTGQDIERVAKDTDRDNYMSAEEALSYGLIDRVIESRETEKQDGREEY